MKIKLGKLPSNAIVRMTIILPDALKGQLDRYAKLHSETWNQSVSSAQIAVHILAQFLATDRAFRQSERSTLIDR
jgi:hypothetical protein